MTFNRRKNPGRDPEKELLKLRKRFGAVTARFARAMLFRRLSRGARRAALIALPLLAALLGLLWAAGARW